MLLALERNKTKARVHLELSLCPDLGALFDLYRQAPYLTPAAPTFDPASGVISGGFWICGRRSDTGRVGHIQAFGLINLGRDRLVDHLQKHPTCYAPHTSAIMPERSHFSAEGVGGLRGRICYHGELFLDRDLQGGGYAARLARAGVLLALERWSLDALWAFVDHRKIRTRFYRALGYPHHTPGGAFWALDDGGSFKEWYIWGRPEEMLAGEGDRHIMSLLAQSEEILPAIVTS